MEKDYITLDVTKIMRALWKRALLLLLCTVVCAFGTNIYSTYFKEKQYVATVSIIVDNRSTVEEDDSSSQKRTNTDITASRYMVDECIAILKNEALLQKTAEIVNRENEDIVSGKIAPMTYGKLSSALSMGAVNATAVLKIKATTSNPQLCVDICHAIVEVAEEELLRTMSIRSVNSVERDNILLPTAPSYPNVRRDTLYGGIIGLALSVGAVVLSQVLDTTVKATDDIERMCGVLVIGEIPSNGQGTGKKNGGKRRRTI